MNLIRNGPNGYNISFVFFMFSNLSYLYSRLEGGGALDNGIGLNTQLAGSVSNLLLP